MSGEENEFESFDSEKQRQHTWQYEKRLATVTKAYADRLRRAGIRVEFLINYGSSNVSKKESKVSNYSMKELC